LTAELKYVIHELNVFLMYGVFIDIIDMCISDYNKYIIPQGN